MYYETTNTKPINQELEVPILGGVRLGVGFHPKSFIIIVQEDTKQHVFEFMREEETLKAFKSLVEGKDQVIACKRASIEKRGDVIRLINNEGGLFSLFFSGILNLLLVVTDQYEETLLKRAEAIKG